MRWKKLWILLNVCWIAVVVNGCASVMSDTDSDSYREAEQLAPTTDAAAQPALVWSDMHYGSITHDGLQREYYFYDPHLDRDADAATPGTRPLLLVLHGGGSHARNVMQRSKLVTIARQSGFVVAFPNGIAAAPGGLFRTWNAGVCCNPAMKKNIDDVGFIQSLITRMIEQQGIDRQRVFVTGFSNGGLLSYHLACQLTESITAIAPVAAVLPTVAECDGARGTALIAFHGRKDKRVRYHGSPAGDGRHRPSVTDSVARWAKINACQAMQEKQKAGFSLKQYSGCRAPVALYSINQLGHRWPGWDRRLWWGKRDPQTSLSVDASQVMWAFFESLSPSRQ